MKHINTLHAKHTGIDGDLSHVREARADDLPLGRDGVGLLDIVALASAVCVAVVLAMGDRLLVHLNADGLIPVLVSLQRWTPFFWGQDRVGMLLPALAWPINHPMWNLIAQLAMAGAMTAGAFMLPPRFFFGRRAGYLVGGLSLLLFLALAGDRQIHRTVHEQHHYGSSITLCFLGLWCLSAWAGAAQRWRLMGLISLAAGACGLLLAGWLNAAILLSIVPMVIVYCGLASVSWSTRRLNLQWPVFARLAVGTTVLAGMSFVGNMVFSRVAAEHRSYVGVLDVAHWLDCWQQLLANTWHEKLAAGWGWALAGVLLVAIFGLALRPGRRGVGQGGAAIVAMIIAAIVQLAFFGILDVVYRNGARPRYMDAALVILSAAIVGTLACVWLAQLPKQYRTGLAAAALLLLPVLAVTRFGLPSPDRARLAINQHLGTNTQAILESNCTHVAGSSWTVVPAVFHANLVLYEQGATRQVWGVSSQTHEANRCWAQMPISSIRIATFHTSPLGPDRERELAAANLAAFNLANVTTISDQARISIIVPASGDDNSLVDAQP